jgi:hypothetical protein
MPAPFNPATDIYYGSDYMRYAQDIANQYQGNRFYVPGFNSGDRPLDFAQNWGRGYYRHYDERSLLTSLGASLWGMYTGQTPLPHTHRNLGETLEVLENSRAYSQARMNMLRDTVADRAIYAGQNIASSRGHYFGAEQANRINRLVNSAAGTALLFGAQATLSPEIFEASFGLGRAGTGMGMFDAAYQYST